MCACAVAGSRVTLKSETTVQRQAEMATAGVVAGPKEVLSGLSPKREPQHFRDLFSALMTNALKLLNK
jgi:hypothetical protein